MCDVVRNLKSCSVSKRRQVRKIQISLSLPQNVAFSWFVLGKEKKSEKLIKRRRTGICRRNRIPLEEILNH